MFLQRFLSKFHPGIISEVFLFSLQIYSWDTYICLRYCRGKSRRVSTGMCYEAYCGIYFTVLPGISCRVPPRMFPGISTSVFLLIILKSEDFNRSSSWDFTQSLIWDLSFRDFLRITSVVFDSSILAEILLECLQVFLSVFVFCKTLPAFTCREGTWDFCHSFSKFIHFSRNWFRSSSQYF